MVCNNIGNEIFLIVEIWFLTQHPEKGNLAHSLNNSILLFHSHQLPIGNKMMSTISSLQTLLLQLSLFFFMFCVDHDLQVQEFYSQKFRDCLLNTG